MLSLTEIADNVKNGRPVTAMERAYLIRNNPAALTAFLVSNNPGSLNFIFRNRFDYDHLKFQPETKPLVRQMEILFENKAADELKVILENYEVLDKGEGSEFYTYLKDFFSR